MKNSKINTRVKRVVVILLSVIIGFSALSVAGSVVVFKILFGRQELDNIFEIKYSMIDASSYARRRVSFCSGENQLTAYIYGEQNDAAVIIVAPGATDTGDAHLAEIMRFVDSGYRVLAYDATGTGESGGESRVGLQQSRLDLLAAIDYAKDNFSIPVILYGHSLGGYAAASVLGEREVAAAISLSGFNSPVETMHGLAKNYVGVLADVEYPFLYLQNYFVFGRDANPSALDAVNSTDTPVLICYGSRDATVTRDLSLYSHKDEITNPNAVCVEITEENRNLHSGMWLEGESAEYLRSKKLEFLSRASELNEKETEDFYSDTDVEKATRLDDDFMDMLMDFCAESLAR